jgi:formylglycine-generating enzyme required for sulfatase activity
MAARRSKRMRACITGRDGKEMVLIPSGPFIMGSEEFGPETPQSTVVLEDYYIDRYPVTNAEYKRFLDETGYAAPKGWSKGEYPAGQSDHPVQLVNWNDACAYAGWARKRLPSEAEWEKAARGVDGRRWPWGNEFRDECAATWETSVLTGEQTTPVTAHPLGASPYGVHEMGGQVEEWVADWFDAHPGSAYRSESYGQHYRVLKGGSWIFTQTHARCAYRCFEKPDAVFEPLLGGPGFRCAADVGTEEDGQ